MDTVRLMIRCPKTGKPMWTGIVITPDAFVGSDFIDLSTQCPYCNEPHSWNKQTAFLESESHN